MKRLQRLLVEEREKERREKGGREEGRSKGNRDGDMKAGTIGVTEAGRGRRRGNVASY